MIVVYSVASRLFSALTCLFLVVVQIKTNAQITVTAPTDNQVIQRDVNGYAELSITAYAAFPYDLVKAVLIPADGRSGGAREHFFDAHQVRQGFLTARIPLETGWYRLTIIGEAAERTDSAIVGKVGVGEVFLVTGNSNAMGLPELGAKDASEQVVSFNAVNKILNHENITVAPDEPMPAATFSPLQKDHFIFPGGETAWYWGELGDMIAQKWQTPVLFFNAAWAAANSDNYRDAATGKDAFNMYVGKNWPNRQPYTNIVNTLRYLTSWTGVRSILFSHGENDAELNFKEEDYFQNIRTLIQNSRRDAGYNVPWIIARNSASYRRPNPILPILNAQNRLAEIDGFNTFKGPYLDTVQNPRQPHGHYENIAGGVQGLTLAAEAWSRSLSEINIEKIAPLQPAFSIHTGVLPARAFPGASFQMHYRLEGLVPDSLQIQAELFNADGSYAGIVGQGSQSSVRVVLPQTLPSGRYRLRLTSTKPFMPGSVSDVMEVNALVRKVDFTRSFTASENGAAVHLSWLLAAQNVAGKVILQKTTDGTTYTDVATFDISQNESTTNQYVDADGGNMTTFYRLKFEATHSFSSIVPIFREGAPEAFTIFPNPVTNQEMYFRLSDTNVQCRLFDIAGREHPIYFNAREVAGMGVVRPVHVLPAGMYVLQILAAERTFSTNISVW